MSGKQTGNPERFKAIALDLLERAGWSAGQVFFATLLAGGTTIGTVAGLPWKYSSVVALGAFGASLTLTLVQDGVRRCIPRSGLVRFWVDLSIRLGETFVASVAGAFLAAHPFGIVSFDWSAAVDIAALAVLGALGKGLLARGGDTDGGTPTPGIPTGNSPSTLPDTIYAEADPRANAHADDPAVNGVPARLSDQASLSPGSRGAR